MEKIIIEIRSAEGGEHSKILIQDQFALYYKVAKINNIWLNILEELPSYISFSAEGKNCFNIFKNEAGGHRIIQIPKTEKKGRIHTSIITVAILKIPEPNELEIKNSEIEYRFIRASSKGGQNANKTESGVVIKHLSSGIEAKSTSDRSQLINKGLAFDLLKSRLFAIKQNETQSEINLDRSHQIGSGHRSDKIRTIRYIDGIVLAERSL